LKSLSRSDRFFTSLVVRLESLDVAARQLDRGIRAAAERREERDAGHDADAQGEQYVRARA
jgi:hypothetical protein